MITLKDVPVWLLNGLFSCKGILLSTLYDEFASRISAPPNAFRIFIDATL
jgi:hypothetical protein